MFALCQSFWCIVSAYVVQQTCHMGTEVTYFRHVPKHLISSPLLHAPVIVVLFRAANAKRSIHTTRPTQKSSTADLDLSASDAVHRLGDDIPVCI
jgi:hypothetical protein